MVVATEVELREDEPSGRVCRKCKRPLFDDEPTVCPACKEEKNELFGEMAAKAILVGGVIAGGFYVLFRGFKLLLRVVGWLTPKKKEK